MVFLSAVTIGTDAVRLCKNGDVLCRKWWLPIHKTVWMAYLGEVT